MSEMLENQTYIQTVAFIMGAMIGSFANVVIYRLPLSLNLVSPRSHCAKCKTPIAWFENIPMVSFLFLRGRCRYCGISIGWIHPLIELTIGLLAMACVIRFGVTFQTFFFFTLLTALLIASMIDLEHRIIPDSISMGGAIVGFLVAVIFQWADKPWHISGIDSMIGLVVGGGFLWSIAWGYEKLTGREGMGFGDVKLVALFGAISGWQGALVSIFIGSVLGSIVGLVMIGFMRGSRRSAIPFGPYLCFGFFLVILDMLNIIHIPIEWVSRNAFTF